ncbi:MAG TPA: flavodoxin domain-containing protein [Candidatus Baltobacteraceae bacterium]|nr:flavodoxin domain-containing protein [Candidatus Baltobacteraceae bacterium]
MSVLVAYASRHGATRGIAERIADRLRQRGLAAETLQAANVRDASRYDAFVVGSAAYMFHWLADATRFVQRNRALLAARPVWLFSSGPLGTDPVDVKGRDQLVAAQPKEFADLRATLHPRGEQVFFGALDPDAPPIGLAERITRHLPAAAREAMPAGDFRDWAAIDAWADGIAAALSPTAAATPA